MQRGAEAEEGIDARPPIPVAAPPAARLSLSLRQARDLDIDAKPRSDQPTRFAFQKLTTAETKARASESLKRLTTNVGDYISKKFWTQAGMEVRRGTHPAAHPPAAHPASSHSCAARWAPSASTWTTLPR